MFHEFPKAYRHFDDKFKWLYVIWFTGYSLVEVQNLSWTKASFMRRCFYQAQLGLSYLGQLCITLSFSLRYVETLCNNYQLFNCSRWWRLLNLPKVHVVQFLKTCQHCVDCNYNFLWSLNLNPKGIWCLLNFIMLCCAQFSQNLFSSPTKIVNLMILPGKIYSWADAVTSAKVSQIVMFSSVNIKNLLV